MPRFSTIVPIYNRGSLIRHTLDSILYQSIETEIIVVDDGSTDDSVAQVEKYASQGVRVIQQNNAGPGTARNTGIAAATGDYLTFLDSDDLWFPHTLETYAACIERHNEPALLIGKAIQFSGDAFPEAPKACPIKALVYNNYYAAAEQAISVVGCCFAVRRDVVKENNAIFGQDHINAEDMDFLLQLGVANGFVWIQEPEVLAYQLAEGSEMSDHLKTHAGLSKLVEKEKNHEFPGGPQLANNRRKVLTRYTRSASIGFKREGDSKLAWELYVKTLAWNIHLRRWKYILGFPFVR